MASGNGCGKEKVEDVVDMRIWDRYLMGIEYYVNTAKKKKSEAGQVSRCKRRNIAMSAWNFVFSRNFHTICVYPGDMCGCSGGRSP